MSQKLCRNIVRKYITVQEKLFSKLAVYKLISYIFMIKYYFNVLEYHLLTVSEPMFVTSISKE